MAGTMTLASDCDISPDTRTQAAKLPQNRFDCPDDSKQANGLAIEMSVFYAAREA